MLAISGFKDPHPFALAEIAVFAAESPLFIRLDQGNPITLAREVDALKNTKSVDKRLLNHIPFEADDGRVDDTPQEMVGLIRIAVGMGRCHRAAAKKITRYGMRRKMYNWIAGTCDTVKRKEQLIAWRDIHTDIDSTPGASLLPTYDEWVVHQIESSPKNRRARELVSNVEARPLSKIVY